MISCLFHSIYCGTTQGGLPWGVALSNILDKDPNAVVWGFPSVTSGVAGAEFCSTWIKSCAP